MRQVDPGNIVHATDANGIVTITQEQPINIVFAVPEIDLSQVLKARAINPDLTVEAWDRDSKNKRNSQRRKTSCVCPGRHDWRGRRPGELPGSKPVPMAMKTGQPYTFLRDFIFTHPSIAKALNELMSQPMS